MPPIARILLVVVVIAAGTTVAMMFRKNDEQMGDKEPTPPQNLALQSNTPRVVTDRTRLEEPLYRDGAQAPRFDRADADSSRRPSGRSVKPASTGDPADRFGADNRALPPMLPPRLDPISPLRPRTNPLGNPLRDPSVSRERLPRRSSSTETVQALRKHKIVDGDTLSNLAKRYLGDHRRYAEIYEINRDVLPSPHALPIGSTLRIPPEEPADDAMMTDDPSRDRSRLRPILPGTVRAGL